jgi:hypothetical protein
MGTRSLTFVYDEFRDTPIINMYRQYDGYMEGHGRELAAFLNGKRITNGIAGNSQNTANGMGCLAAQMVASFKTEVGNFYLYPVSMKDCGQDYEYHVYKDRVRVVDYSGRLVFEGDWDEFHQATHKELA